MIHIPTNVLLIGADPQVITVPDPDTVSPGFIGFAVTFLLAIATLLLIRSMVGRVRSVLHSPDPEEQVQSAEKEEPTETSASGPG